MVNWPIRRKLLVLPLIGVTVTGLMMALVKDRLTLLVCCGVGAVALLAVAWRSATTLSRRIGDLHQAIAQAVDRGSRRRPRRKPSGMN